MMTSLFHFLSARWSVFGCSILPKYGTRFCHRLRNGSVSTAEEVLRDNTDDQATALESAYTKAEQQKILKVLNGSTCNQLMQYEVNKPNVMRLIKHRDSLGSFRTLHDLLEVEISIGLTPLYSLCDSILYGLSTEGRVQQSTKWKVCYPSLPEELVEARTIVNKLPIADIYLMDDRKMELRSMKTTPLILRTVRLECMITALLEGNFVQTNCNRVYLIKGDVVGKYFQLKVGNEQVSGQHLVQNIVHGTGSPDVRKAVMDADTWSWYIKQTPDIKEHLTNSLLKAIAFYQLEVAKIPVR